MATGKTTGMIGGQATIDLIKEMEGYRATAYVDASGYSIGYGHFIKKGEEHLMKANLSEKEAEKLLHEDIADHQVMIKKLLKVNLSDEKIAALTSAAYNLGKYSESVKSAIEHINAGDDAKAAQVLAKANKSYDPKLKEKTVNPHLVERRAFEGKILRGEETQTPAMAWRNRGKEKKPDSAPRQMLSQRDQLAEPPQVGAQEAQQPAANSMVSGNERILIELEALNVKMKQKLMATEQPGLWTRFKKGVGL